MIIENALRMMRMILKVFLTLSTLKHSEFHYILCYIVCFVHWDPNLLVVYSHREEDLKETGQSKGMFYKVLQVMYKIVQFCTLNMADLQ